MHGPDESEAAPHAPFDVPEGDPFGPHNLPYGVFSPSGSTERRVGVRLGDQVLDAGAAAAALGSPHHSLLARPTLNALLAAARPGPRYGARSRTGSPTPRTARPSSRCSTPCPR